MIQTVLRPFKKLLPEGKRYRKLRFGPAAGCLMEIDLRCQLRSYFGIYEFELLPHFKRMVTPGANCFDIGGRDGYDALMMASLSHGKVASFECDQIVAQRMRHTFAQNPGLSIETVESFVGAENSDKHITIDRASRELFIPNFIKMDIEGAEADALNGAIETLKSHRPSLIIEAHGSDIEDQCLSILRQIGYRVTIVNQSRFLKDAARTGYNRWIAASPNL
jgi:hypothetical protein